MTRFCPNVCGEINVGPMQTEATAERSRRQGAPRVVSRLTMCYRKQLCGGGTLTGHLPYRLRTVQVSVPAVGKSRTCRRGRESWRRWAPDPEQLLEPTGSCLRAAHRQQEERSRAFGAHAARVKWNALSDVEGQVGETLGLTGLHWPSPQMGWYRLPWVACSLACPLVPYPLGPSMVPGAAAGTGDISAMSCLRGAQHPTYGFKTDEWESGVL